MVVIQIILASILGIATILSIIIILRIDNWSIITRILASVPILLCEFILILKTLLLDNTTDVICLFLFGFVIMAPMLITYYVEEY